MHVCKIHEILNRIFTIIFCALHVFFYNIQVKFMIVPLVLLIDPCVVSEKEHSEPPCQKRKLDDGNPK